MPKVTYLGRKLEVGEGNFIDDDDDLAKEAMTGVGLGIREEKTNSEIEQANITSPKRSVVINTIDVCKILIDLYGPIHALALLVHLNKLLDKIAKACEQPTSESIVLNKKEKQILIAIIMSSATRNELDRSTLERIGILLHLISLALWLWGRSA